MWTWDRRKRYSNKPRRVRRGRLRQLMKLIPNTVIMKFYDNDGRYIKKALVELLDKEDETNVFTY